MSTCAFLKICSDLAGLAFCSMRSSLLQMDGDFAKYVIGINDGWLSLHLDEDVWQSPDERLRDLLPTLELSEQRAWERYEEVGRTVGELEWAGLLGGFKDAECNGDSPADEQQCPQLAKAEQEQEAALEQLRSNLTPEHLAEVDSILEAKADYGPRHTPRFDSGLIQRYVLWRVFDLGWTVERFGQCDRFSVGYSGREAAKPERIGKKYQWIAYHEILAHISDHYQYREQFSAEADARQYEGPWQERLRDIDPSCTLRSIPGGTSWGPHNPSWWGKAVYAAWEEGTSHKDWLASKEDIPKTEEFLEVDCPKDDSRWLNVKGRFVWQEPHPPDVEPHDVERRELRLSCTGYFVPSDDIDSFTDWVNSADDTLHCAMKMSVYERTDVDHERAIEDSGVKRSTGREGVGGRGGQAAGCERAPCMATTESISKGGSCWSGSRKQRQKAIYHHVSGDSGEGDGPGQGPLLRLQPFPSD